MTTISLNESTLPGLFSSNSGYNNAVAYRAIITQATHAMNPMLHLLDMRAEAYAMIAQFEQALDDACSLIRIAPTLPIGYLRAGLILQMRGNSAVAVRVYEEALSRVAPAGGSVLELHDRLHKATTQLERRLDPFLQLPNELLTSVFDQLSDNDLAQCIAVDKTWEAWLQHHKFLEPFSTLKIEKKSSGEATWQRLRITSRHIRSLKLADPSFFEASGMLNLATNPRNFENLRTLDLKYCTFPATTTTQLIAHLPLTSLSIECALVVAPPLEDILLSCPTLLHLAYKATLPTWIFSIPQDVNVVIPINSSITDINPGICYRLQCLRVVGTTDVDRMVQRIYRRCPDLRELWIHNPFAGNLLQIVHHLPKLQVFRINANVNISTDQDNPSYFSLLSSEEQAGLRVLEIKETDSASIDESAPLIEAHAATLRELSLTSSFFEGIKHSFCTPFRCLTTLILARFNNKFQHVRTILEQCPVLDSLMLQDVTIDPFLLDALCATASLRHLALDLCRIETPYNVEAFFGHYSRSTKSTASLTSVTLRRIQLTSQTLYYLASIKTIRRIELAQLHIIDSDYSVADFIKRLEQTSYIQHLAFGPLVPVTDAHIKLLGNITSLQTVTFRHLDSITDQGVKALPARIKVEVIKLYNPPEMEDESSYDEDEDEDEDEEVWYGYIN